MLMDLPVLASLELSFELFNGQLAETMIRGFREIEIKRRTLKVRLKCSDRLRSTTKLDNIVGFIEEMAELMEQSVSQDFVFSFILTTCDGIMRQAIEARLTRTCTCFGVQVLREPRRDLVVHMTNKNNSMCGYQEQWMYIR